MRPPARSIFSPPVTIFPAMGSSAMSICAAWIHRISAPAASASVAISWFPQTLARSFAVARFYGTVGVTATVAR